MLENILECKVRACFEEHSSVDYPLSMVPLLKGRKSCEVATRLSIFMNGTPGCLRVGESGYTAKIVSENVSELDVRTRLEKVHSIDH